MTELGRAYRRRGQLTCLTMVVLSMHMVVDAFVPPVCHLEAAVRRRRNHWSEIPLSSSTSYSSFSLSAENVSEKLQATRERNKQLGRGILDVFVFAAVNVASIAKKVFVYSVSMIITWSFIQTKNALTLIASTVYSTIIDFLTRVVGYSLMATGRCIKLAFKGGWGSGKEVQEEEATTTAKKAIHRLDTKNEEDQRREQEQYKKIFEEIDSNGDERISLEELKVYMKSKYDNISDVDIKVMMEEADHDNNRSLDFSEFLTAMKKSLTFETTYAWRLAQAATQEQDSGKNYKQ